MLVPDGTFTSTAGGRVVAFQELPPPSEAEVAQLLSRVARCIVRLLRRRGRLEDDIGPKDALETLRGVSVLTRLPTSRSPGAGPQPLRCTSGERDAEPPGKRV